MTIFMLKLKMQENIFIKLLLDVGRWTLYIPMGLVFSFQFSVFSFLPFYFFYKQVLHFQLLPAEYQLCTRLIIKLGGDV